MAIVEAISIPIGVTGQDTVDKAANSYEDLGDAVAKTQLEAEKLANTFGINDKRTQDAIKVAGKYKQEMEQLDSAIDGARGGVATLTRATQGVVAGFEVAAGAAGLFGGESEELQKMLLKVQSAMALAQGLKDFKEFGPAIKGVATLVQGNLVKAFKTFSTAARSALAATGIGLFIVALGSIVAYWDDIIKAVSGTDAEQLKLLESQQKSATTAQEQLDSISEQENILKQQGKTEEEILQMKIAATKTTITALEAQLVTQEQVKKAQIDASKRNQDILKGLINFISLPLTALLATVDGVGKALGQDFGLLEGFTGGLAEMVFDPKEVEKKGDETIKETQTQLDKLKNNLAGHENTVKANATKKAEEKKANDKKAEQAAEEAFQKWLAIEVAKAETTESNAKFFKDRLDKEYADKIKAEEDFKAFLEKSASDESKFIDEQFLIRQLALTKSITDEKALQDASDLLEIERLNNRIMAAKDANESSVQLELDLAAKKKEIKDKEVDEEKKRKETVAALEKEIFDNSQELAQAVINIVGQNTKAGKALALASIAADTARALSGALANSQAPTPDNVATGGLAGIAKYIALATTILTNSKRAYDIIKAPAPSTAIGGGGGGAGAAAAVPRFNAPTTRLQQNDEFTQVRRIYVTERDITNVQDKVRVTEGLSQF